MSERRSVDMDKTQWQLEKPGTSEILWVTDDLDSKGTIGVAVIDITDDDTRSITLTPSDARSLGKWLLRNFGEACEKSA